MTPPLPTVTVTPVNQQAAEAKLFEFHAPDVLLVRSFSLMLDGRDRKTLIPSRDFRLVSTGLIVDIPKPLFPLVTTPLGLHTKRLEATSFHIFDGQLEIVVQSFRHDSINLDNGTAIAELVFVNGQAFEVKTGAVKK